MRGHSGAGDRSRSRVFIGESRAAGYPVWPSEFNISLNFDVPAKNLSIPTVITYTFPDEIVYHSQCFEDPRPCAFLFTATGVWTYHPQQQECCLDHTVSEGIAAPAPNWIQQSMRFNGTINYNGQPAWNYTAQSVTPSDWTHYYVTSADGQYTPLEFRDHVNTDTPLPMSYWRFTQPFQVGTQTPQTFNVPAYCNASDLCYPPNATAHPAAVPRMWRQAPLFKLP
eukprot:TRINITY_DN19613_c0_g1_i2.p1 TRINITY_DN19613_c0_g1~~TRINITY_DN19613_c0_g1_i2.p1  ORF type:complete len:249 (+),score=38.44 TRINITY_DN19613_c0_g1_i2:74-748(+)